MRNQTGWKLAVAMAIVGCAYSVGSAAEGVDLKVGDPAPKFEAMDDTGKLWKSGDVVGKGIVVVYFYPADMTGGCTKQACGFRDDMKTLKDRGITVIGVSGDSVRNHELFKKEYDLNFPLLADTEGKVATAFGVPFTVGEKTVKKEVDGKEVEFVRNITTQRWTFVIDADGKIASKNTKVAAAEDSQAILKQVESLEK